MRHVSRLAQSWGKRKGFTQMGESPVRTMGRTLRQDSPSCHRAGPLEVGIHLLHKYLLLALSVPRAVVGSGTTDGLIVKLGRQRINQQRITEWEGFRQY